MSTATLEHCFVRFAPDDDTPICSRCQKPEDDVRGEPCGATPECSHVDTYDDEDQYGQTYIVCEDCGAEVEQEDTRSFYWDEDTGKVAW